MTDEQLRKIADESLLMAKWLAHHQNSYQVKMPVAFAGRLLRKLVIRPFHKIMGWGYPELRGSDVERIVTSALNAGNALDWILKQKDR